MLRALERNIYYYFIYTCKSSFMKNGKLTDSFTEEKNVGKAERIVSSGAGAALLYKGVRDLRSSSLLSIGELLAGAYLVFRGVTAYCPIRDVMQKEYPRQPEHVVEREFEEEFY